MKTSIKIQTREWAPGDLVEIKKTSWDGGAYKSIGIVIYEVKETQQKVFPAVYVYDTHSGQSEEIYIYELELISPAT